MSEWEEVDISEKETSQVSIEVVCASSFQINCLLMQLYQNGNKKSDNIGGNAEQVTGKMDHGTIRCNRQ